MTDPLLATPSGRPRARALPVPFDGTPGPLNAITDVPGVEVGYCTLVRGEGPLVVGRGPVRTGVTAILPRGQAGLGLPVFAGSHALNGNGELTGTLWIEESGQCEGPVTITNTHACGVARDATARWLVERHPEAIGDWGLPVAGETYDGELNDINGFHVTAEHVFEALESARGGPLELGSVGGGTGMICYDFKGGSGSASRAVPIDGESYLLGAFVQANFGRRRELTVAGVPVGRHLPGGELRSKPAGSIIAVIATDAPLLPHQLKRLARRVGLGIARSGGTAHNGSGDIFLAVSTANPAAWGTGGGPQSAAFLANDRLDPLFEAVVQATDEAVIDAMVANETMVGRDGNTALALPHDRLRDLLARYGRGAE
ncbi:MAG: P1 family peptidase [Rhodospirillales bacterium]|nr:P1 family peptidase [Rhodospirillales bacterium]MDH3791209.1 P1 family peptidase [Rhodospirillales bacterium]MDH3911229.1 P1 family peptidase [Rhodospirillales bacterium]MDH3917065.1 P1 family peptidase [Rhodospirillales bacterium]MDH3966453.1 P1 family peptidase [Rhodospirillales bacterium]